jgi:hypothetical protein
MTKKLAVVRKQQVQISHHFDQRLNLVLGGQQAHTSVPHLHPHSDRSNQCVVQTVLRSTFCARFDQLIFAAGPLTVLPFDEASALVCGRYRALREREGLHAPPSDMMIAGIAGALGADLATRNTKDFSGLPIMVINPWMA